jgi:hypothetical protein
MGLLCFDKPKKAHSTEDHNIACSSDCGIPGTYVPNMSREDRAEWKGKIVGKKKGCPQVEIRKDSFVTVIGLNGYNYKWYRVGDKSSDTSGLNIHVASAGPIQMTFKDWEEWNQVIEEAKEILENI